MKKLILLVAVLFTVAGTQYVLQLAPTAVITIEAWSPQELHDAGMEGHGSTGLSVVGVEETVYLLGSESGGEAVLSFAWTVTSPGGFAVNTSNPTGERTTFHPEETGLFTVGLTITTASGTATTSTQVMAATYVGVGNLGGASPDFAKGQCAGCHPGNAADWAATDHATLFTLGIDGIASDHYMERCIVCHTVGYNLDADNGGFDDVARELGWAFPSHPGPGEWQNIVDNFPQLAQLANIQCENCHGPGSQHKGNPAGIEVSALTGVCATCHDEGDRHNKPTQWKRSGHHLGTSFSRGGSSSCARCHSTYGFIAYVDPLSELDQQVGTGEGVECAACHDPHDVNNPGQLRTIEDVTLADGTVVTWGGSGKLCMNCHQARRTGAVVVPSGTTRIDPHHSNQGDMLAANNVAITFGRYIPSSTHRDALENACVDCHMGPTLGTGELGRFHVGDHTFAMAADMDGIVVENVQTCVRCHGDIESFDDIMAREDYDGDGTVETAREELHGVEDQLAMLIPPLGSTDFPAAGSPANNALTTMQKNGLFNLNFVHDDASDGIHNYQYAMGLLKVSIEALTYGVLAPGAITAIADVPNDQGKMVQVVWERFGGDGTSTDPVAMYYVWRQDMMPTAGKGIETTLDKVDVDGSDAGARILLNDMVWTAVASVPAAQLDYYSAVAATLFDEAETTFLVSGHTAANVVSMSAPVVGTSVDNLVPHAPTGIMAATTSFDVTLTWEENVDPDIDYYAVYRSTVMGFDPASVEPVATTTDPTFFDNTVTPGNTYYYQVAAYDFSGNQGAFSGEVAAAVSVANEDLGLPTDYALHQNYPNPFNPTTTISFDVPVASDISIAVYDLLGRQVRTLVNASQSAGRHQVTFDASGLTSGLYIVRMRTGDRVFERSVVLMK